MEFDSRLAIELDRLCTEGSTGALHCDVGHYHKAIFLIEGVITAVDSDDPADDLACRLLCERRVEACELLRAQELALDTQRPLVDLLVEEYLLDSETLEHELMNQARDAVRRMLKRSDVSHRYIEDELPEDCPAAVTLEWTEVTGELKSLVTANLPAPRLDLAAAWELVERGRLAIEGQRFEEGVHLFRRAETLAPAEDKIVKIRSNSEEFYCSLLAGAGLAMDARLEMAMPHDEMGDVFRPASYRLLGRIDGTATIGELLEYTGGSMVDAMKSILELEGWGVVRIVPAHQSEPAAVGVA